MALIHKNNNAIYSGVSKQANELRLDGYVEEMVNCYPTIQYGVCRRKPTQFLSSSIIASDNQFFHSYDRGLSGESSEQYIVTIDNTNGLRVLDVLSGTYKTVTYAGNAHKYLENSNPELGFSAITIKDTTFIANKDIIPLMQGQTSSTVNYKSIVLNMHGYSESVVVSASDKNGNAMPLTALAPARIRKFTDTLNPNINYYAISSAGATITITVDGKAVSYTTKVRDNGVNIIPETMGEYRTNIMSLLTSELGSGYKVTLDSSGSIYVYKLDGTAITLTTSSISYPASVTTNPQALSKFPNYKWTFHSEYNSSAVVVNSIGSGSGTQFIQSLSDYDKQAFVWVKQVSPDSTFPYTFYVELRETNGSTIASFNTSATSTTGVASAISAWALGLADFTASVSGSVVKITRDSGADFDVILSDTYGNQASKAFKGSISTLDDVPKSFPFKNTILRVKGVQAIDSASYWIKYDGNKWNETFDPNMLSKVNDETMPHKLTRNADGTFTLAVVDWNDLAVGDSDSNPMPEFFGDSIRDMFIIGGRFGIVSRNGITLSQQGNFFNFFRTTILQLLDDSAITTYIDSSKSVGLEYAVELQGNIVLFGDKLQFALDGSRAISPKTISVQPISGFEINKNVKPISVGDSVFFIVKKSGYSAVMEMSKNTISSSIRADDISAHIPDYIDSDIMQIVSSQQDNAVFLRSRSRYDTIYVYKYFGSDQQRLQTSWSKWTFASKINSVFAFNGKLYLFGSRFNTTVPIEEYPLATAWYDTRYWIDETSWVDGEIATSPSFEYVEINSNTYNGDYRDNGTIRYDSTVELSEWVYSNSNIKDPRINVLVKTIDISSVDGSNFNLTVEDKERGTSRSIPAIYTVDRRPYISGNAKNMKISIESNGGDGFQISSISLEGQINARSRNVR